MAMNQYWADLEQPEYDPEEFVERLAFRARSAGSGGQGGRGELSDAQQLHTAFLTAIKDLKLMHEKQTTKCEELEESVREEERAHWARVAGLIQRNKASATTYKSLMRESTWLLERLFILETNWRALTHPELGLKKL